MVKQVPLHYQAPWWLPGGHAQSIVPALFGRTAYSRTTVAARYVRERWSAPDGDFVDVDFGLQPAQAGKPLLVLFHGLEGSSASHYARAFLHWCEQQGLGFAVPHFRGCSGEMNHAPRAYHSGDWHEIDWLVRRLHQRAAPQGQALLLVGVSLGGSALLRWAQELGPQAGSYARAIAAICAPLDLAAGSQALARGFGRYTYTRNFLRTMLPHALARLQRHPGLFDAQAMRAAKTLHDFDEIFTAPLHGFANAADYYARASAGKRLHQISLPALVVNARNDPFVPAQVLPKQAEVGPWVQLWQPVHGGHVGFGSGAFWPGHIDALPAQVGRWLLAQ